MKVFKTSIQSRPLVILGPTLYINEIILDLDSRARKLLTLIILINL